MSLVQKLKAGAVLGATALGAGSAEAFLYDDFSSGALDPDKWIESRDVEGQPFTDEHFVDSILLHYHTAQIEVVDRRTYLVPTLRFNPGDSFEYKSRYVSGSGNNGHVILVNNGIAPNRHGVFGFNNGNHPYQDGFGWYNLRLDFLQNGINISVRGPNGGVWNNKTLNNSASAPYTMYIGTFNGDNGRTHIDFDDFYYSPVPDSPTLAGLAIGVVGLAAMSRKRKKQK